VQKPQFQFTLPQLLAATTWLALVLASARYLSSVSKESFVVSAGTFSVAVVSLTAIVFLYLRFYSPASLNFTGDVADRMRVFSGALLTAMLLATIVAITAVGEPNWLLGVAEMILTVLGVVSFAILAVRGPSAGRVFCVTVLVIELSGTAFLMLECQLFQHFPWSRADMAAFSDNVRQGASGIWAVAIVSGLLFSLLAWSLPLLRRQSRSKLQAFVSAGRDLQARHIADEESFQAWKDEVRRWQADCREWAASRRSPEDLATITDPPPVDSICLEQFNPEHGNLICKVEGLTEILSKLGEQPAALIRMGCSDASELSETKAPAGDFELNQAGPYAVVVLNDDQHTFAFVTETMMKVFGYSAELCFQLAMAIHSGGRAVVWSGSLEMAEQKARELRSASADRHASTTVEFPLQVVIEPIG
jgi:ATP-dependent Clp protease adaptor protein ClpS